MSKQTRLLAAIMLLSMVTAAAYAAIGRGQRINSIAVSDGYRSDEGRDPSYRQALSGTDIADVGTAALSSSYGVDGLTQIYCKGFARVAISGLFSSASATAVVYVSRHNKGTASWSFRSGYEGTLTAVASRPTVGSLYPSTRSLTVSTHGAEWLVVTSAAPSAGTVALNAEVY